MKDKEEILSQYIDSLNAEKRPKEHHTPIDSPELEELFETVRKVRSLKEPTMPNDSFKENLSQSLLQNLSPKIGKKDNKGRWFTVVASMAAVLIMAVFMNFFSKLGGGDIVYAMEKAFHEVKAYHGFLEIVQINAEGHSTSQRTLEVWADKEGHYYTKTLEGSSAGLITANNGQQKWQIRPDLNQVHLFPAFPDTYGFTFELGKEIENVKNALSYEIVGEDMVDGRKANLIKISPDGGLPYHIWIDTETKLPLQKEYALQNALQYKITYKEIEFLDAIPEELTSYHLPAGYEEINTNPEQIITDMDEAKKVLGFTPKVLNKVPAGYIQDNIAIQPNAELVKLYYTTVNENTKIVFIQGKTDDAFRPASNAILGKINHHDVEIQSPVYEDLGILGGGLYSEITRLTSLRWQQKDFEYAVVGNVSLEELITFTKDLTNATIEIPTSDQEFSVKPQVHVTVDLQVEENEQKSVDAGSSPWKLDPAFVAQVFVSLKMNPEGIIGEYPIQEKDLKILQNNGKNAIVEITRDITPIKRVYLQRLVRQDSTGIWTVVGYDSL